MEKVGLWGVRKYPERKSMDDISTFIGWNKIKELVNSCELQSYNEWRSPKRDASKLIERDKALITTLFLTGGRVREVLSLRRENFDFSHPEYITVKDMLLEKIFRKVASYIEVLHIQPRRNVFAPLYKPKLLRDGTTVWSRKRWETDINSEKVRKRRIRKPFPIFKNEALVPILENWVTKSEDLLFPSYDIRRIGKPLSSVRSWQIVKSVGRLCNLDLWNHWFRIQRASQLFYEYNLTWEELKLWFSWQTDVMAEKYPRGEVEDLALRIMKRRTTRV